MPVFTIQYDLKANSYLISREQNCGDIFKHYLMSRIVMCYVIDRWVKVYIQLIKFIKSMQWFIKTKIFKYFVE